MKWNWKRSIISLLLALLVLPLCVMRSVKAAETTSTIEEHYLGFASDLHDTADTLEGAFGSFPNNPEYVSLIGDMVGARGGDAPAFKTSDLLDRIIAIDTCADIEEDGSNVSVVWADHDAGVTDDAGIMKGMGNPAGYTSEQIYEGKNEDGSTSYYIYVVGFYHMLKGGDTSKDAADAFKSWVKDKDVTVPVIVLCHAPLVAKRGDNNGATYWSEALNYAATGVEDITTEDQTDTPLIRDVIFLFGHNHTVDANEYVYEVGSVMSVQVDTTSGLLGADRDSLTATESYDEEVAEEQELTGPPDGSRPPNVAATGTSTRVYFTALTPGYLKTSGSATLITIADETITFTKYNKDGEADLGVTAGGETVESPLVLKRVAWGEPTYTWSDDLSTVTATRALVDNPSYTETEIVNTNKSISKAATCSEKGETTYTAIFTNEAFETQTKTLDDIEATGHDWGEWVVTKEATVDEEGVETRTCKNDPSHTETRAIPKLEPKGTNNTPVSNKSSVATPKTGDSNQTEFWVAIMLFSAGILTTSRLFAWRKND